MEIKDMHVMFRELAQQMGLQTVRAIFSENIDLCLNQAITTKINNVLQENIGSTSNKIKQIGVSPLNSLRSLYKESIINDETINGQGTEVLPYTFTIDTTNIMLITSFKVIYNNKIYDCRIIENENISNTLNDYCNRASKNYPIITTFGDKNIIDIHLYTDGYKPNNIKYSFIKTPAVVVYDEENELNNVNCDLPNYLHNEIVENAVKYYLSSIGKN